MQIHDLIQGCDAWHAYRADHFNASDAPAMMGMSPYKTRTELLHERFTGVTPDIDAATQARFDDGHRFEALARALAEEIVGDELYPVTGSLDRLSASFDGLTMDESTAFEHKSINDMIRSATCAADLPPHLRIQMEQQLLVASAERVLFMASKWDDEGKLIEEKHFWYAPDLDLRAQIVAGWDQFHKDLAGYQPKVIVEKPKASAIMQLPALAIQIRGEVTLSNLPQFKAAAAEFIAAIRTDLVTDEDFANAEATVKFCDKAEKDLEQAKSSAIAQTASIDELMRTINFIQSELRGKRLMLDKVVTSRKAAIKEQIILNAKEAYAEHVRALEKEMIPVRLPAFMGADFNTAAKNKRTLASLHDAIDSELARAKIAADAMALDYRSKIAWCKSTAGELMFLFADLQNIVTKAEDDFQPLVHNRIADHRRKEAQRLEAERARIHEEERIKAEAALRHQAEEAARANVVPPQPVAPVAVVPSAAPTAPVRMLSPAAAWTPPSRAPELRLGQISERLGFAVTADFLRTLGFEPAGREKSAVLFHDAQFAQICDALVRHIQSVCEPQVA